MIDFRDHDQHEHGIVPSLDFQPDPELAQRIRDGLNQRKDDEAFRAADERMRGGQ